MVDPAPKTPTATWRKRAMTILQACTYRGVVILLQTNSINRVNSIDHRHGSWQGGLQRAMDSRFQVPSIWSLINAQPTPVVAGLEGYTLRALSFESGLSWTSGDNANTFGTLPTGPRGTHAYAYGRGLQATSQSGGQARTRVAVSTAMECYVATQKVGDSYRVTVDGVEIAKVTSTSAVRKWRKHEKIGMPVGEHTMVVEFLSGSCLFDAIDHHIGSERKGIRIVDAGKSGVSLNAYAKTGPASDPDQKWAEIHPLLADDQVSGVDIGILTLGTNNMGDSESAFELMLDEYAAKFFEVNKNGLLQIMLDPQPNAISASGDDWPGKHRAARRVASRYEWVSVDTLWAGDTPGRIPRIENTQSDLITGLHPKSKLYLGDLLPYGYVKTSAAIIDQSMFTGTAPDPGDGGGTGDTTPPTVTVITGDNLTVNPDGTFTFAADIVDASAIGIAAVRTVAGDLLGNLVKTTGTRYELTMTWQQLRAFLADGDTLIRWFIVAYDAPGNRAATSARNLTVALNTSAPVLPTIDNITATGFETPGAPIVISADISHPSGIELAPINIEGVYAGIELTKPTTGIRWTGSFDRLLFQNGDDYAVGARSNAGTARFSSRIGYTYAGVTDSTPPTGRMTKPVTNTTLPEMVDLEAYAIDTESGMSKVEFFAEQTLIEDGTYTSAGLFAKTVARQLILDAAPLARRMRARLTDKAGNQTWTQWVDYSVPDASQAPTGIFIPFLDPDDLLPGEAAVRAAWSAAFGSGGLVRNPTTGKLYDPTR